MIPIKKIALPNNEIYAYRESGASGKNILLFVHGMLDSSLYWEIVIPMLTDNFRCLAVDLRGHGQSSYNTKVNDISDFADDLKFFTDALGIKKFTMIGWSMGGAITLKFAAKYPEYLNNIILHSAVGISGWTLPELDKEGKETGKKVSTRKEIESHPMVIGTEEPILKKNKEEVKKSEMECLYHGLKQPEPQRMDAYVLDILLCRSTKDLFWALSAFNISDKHNGVVSGTGEYAKIKCKVMILHGDKDQIVPLRDAEETAKALKELALLKIFAGAGHAVLEDYRKEFIDLVQDFALKL